MPQNPTPNGADPEPRQRPSWYIPIQPIPEDDHRTTAEVLSDTWGDDPVEMSEEEAAETKAYLDQFLVPRDS